MKRSARFVMFLFGLSIMGVSCNEAKKDKETPENKKAKTEEKTKADEPDGGDLITLSDERQEGIRVPEGFNVTKLAETGAIARSLFVRDNGDIYVLFKEPKDDGSCMAALRDTDGDGTADSTAYFGEYSGRGAVHIRGDYLYHSTDTSVLRTKFASEEELVPSGETEVIVKGFEFHGEHGNKTFALDDENGLYVSVGAPSNACQKENRTPKSPGMDPCPLLEKYGGIWKFEADKTHQKQEDGEHYATGIRNMVAITWNRKEQQLYGLQHGRDQLKQFFPDKFSGKESANLPAEEMFKIDEGDNFGWPYCFYNPENEAKTLNPEYGGDGETTEGCEDFEDPIAYFPAHFAPNSVVFYDEGAFPEMYHHGAFIAFHGSWNRNEYKQWGYCIAFVPFEGDMPAGDDWGTFAGGFEGPERVSNPDAAIHRPCGVTTGPDGALYVSDSQKGHIWKITHED